MGCVSSHEQDEKKSIGSRRTSQYQQQQLQQQQQQQVKLQQVRQQQPVNGSQHQLQQMQQKNATENGSAATQAPIQTGKEYFCESFAQNLISFEVSFMMYPPWGQMLRIIN